jgi:hypothetical protein
MAYKFLEQTMTMAVASRQRAAEEAKRAFAREQYEKRQPSNLPAY